MGYDPRFCDERHENIDKEFLRVWKRVNGTDKKLWALIIMALGTLVAVLLK